MRTVNRPRRGLAMGLLSIASVGLVLFILGSTPSSVGNLTLISWAGSSKPQQSSSLDGLPKGFIYLHEIEPTIIEEMRYASDHNFTGKPVPGYLAPRCILTQEAAKALSQVQAELNQYSMTLKVYDCYRPQIAVNSFMVWSKDIKDQKMKGEFYPKVDKRNVFKEGYVAERSGHSRGSTVDLAIAPLPIPNQDTYKSGQTLNECYTSSDKRFKDGVLDFGTGWDCFDVLSHTSNPGVTPEQKRNRLMLKSIMEKNGFKNYEYEWWHFTLNNEPYPNQYFDFPVR